MLKRLLHDTTFQALNIRIRFSLYKHVLLVCLISWLGFAVQGQTYSGDLTLYTQDQANAFNYTEVTGTLVITSTGATFGTPITDLSALSKLKKVGGDLNISYTGRLKSFAGLNNLTSVGGKVIVYYNVSLTTTAGLDNLASVAGDFYVAVNDSMKSVTGLNHLTSVGGYIYIGNNRSLTSVAGLDQITFLGDDLTIQYNRLLSTCCILPSVIAYLNGRISISNNAPGCNNIGEVNSTCKPPATISVSYADGSGQQTSGNVIRPYLQLNNDGHSPVALKDIVIRYWLTVEDFDSLNTSISWAKIGTSLVSARYVPFGQPRSGAYGYIEYAFYSADSLAAMSNSGPIFSQISKADWTNFNQANDYSYASALDYGKNDKITAYYNGSLVWGTEPALLPVEYQSLPAYSATRDGTTNGNSIGTVLHIDNRGTRPISYRDLTIRYWFTSEGNQPLLYQLDYAKMARLSVTARLVKLPTPLPMADTYLELGFTAADSLYPMSSTGDLLLRIRKSDWSPFDQLNDYSYVNSSPSTGNYHITVYLKPGTPGAPTGLVYGAEPTASGVLSSRTAAGTAAEPPRRGLQVAVLGNPVRSDAVEMMISGAQGERMMVRIVDALGRTVSQRQIERAAAEQRVSMPLGHKTNGLLYVHVSTSKEVKTISIVKAK